MIKSIMLSLFVAIYITGHDASSAGIDPSQKRWYEQYKKQANAPSPQEMRLNTDPEPKQPPEAKPLFNGKDLEGWERKGGDSEFEVRNGVIVGRCKPGSPSTYLCTTRSNFADFLFTCEMKWEEDGNSGVMFRARSRPGSGSHETVFGPQAEMEGFSKDRHWSGGIYGQSCGGFFYPLWLTEHKAVRAALKPEEWNRLTVLAVGDVVKTWVNGAPAAHWVDDGSFRSGFFGLQIHKGAKGVVLWRGLRVKEYADQ
ncbi:hypothetical protein KOR34_01510 [Posidoniimonas corsicana]|uniref:3-keto-alpha-glucoside-1,2-lyase/3-keto-2-hydroxy-glucal hydratase domain-containing protein n=1 Tax=Posidoniimonas corsicana TaxID=1938618 RepID=A0A5C5VB98_9BACT|nr:DUF1080 domain-containing protein [Posidoniimonas corsicana]TWT35263.1 hypothetical protein KOR34_01510 [Posidoniimonas corsicana]